MSKPALRIEALHHGFLGRPLFEDLSLEIERHELVAVMGPSGCGKSTLLNLCSGLLLPQRGKLERNYTRHAFIFQEPRLLNWLTARDNILYPIRFLTGRKSPKTIESRLETLRQLIRLEEADLEKYPPELSGGMAQRVALARALITNPDFLFCDEPFSALDPLLRIHLQDHLIALSRNLGFAMMFVTHDLHEAVRLAHRILILPMDPNQTVAAYIPDGLPGRRSDDACFAMVAELRTRSVFVDILNSVLA
ncbi:MAG: ABC transporter ATP-binding protein [Asticcacaulis sp.]